MRVGIYVGIWQASGISDSVPNYIQPWESSVKSLRSCEAAGGRQFRLGFLANCQVLRGHYGVLAGVIMLEGP